jgi:hypothetical protein
LRLLLHKVQYLSPQTTTLHTIRSALNSGQKDFTRCVPTDLDHAPVLVGRALDKLALGQSFRGEWAELPGYDVFLEPLPETGDGTGLTRLGRLGKLPLGEGANNLEQTARFNFATSR